MSDQPDILMDRMSGQSGEDESLETDLSVADRMAKFEAAWIESTELDADLRHAEVNGELSPEEWGTRNSALMDLQSSGAFHASSITQEEMTEAVQKGEISQSQADTATSYAAQYGELLGPDQTQTIEQEPFNPFTASDDELDRFADDLANDDLSQSNDLSQDFGESLSDD